VLLKTSFICLASLAGTRLLSQNLLLPAKDSGLRVPVNIPELPVLSHKDSSLGKNFCFKKSSFIRWEEKAKIVLCTGIKVNLRLSKKAAKILGEILNVKTVELIYTGTSNLFIDLARSFLNWIHIDLLGSGNNLAIKSAKKVLNQGFSENREFFKEFFAYYKKHGTYPKEFELNLFKNKPKKIVLFGLSAGSQVLTVAALKFLSEIQEDSTKENRQLLEQALRHVFYFVFWGCPQSKREIKKLQKFLPLKNFHFKRDLVYEISGGLSTLPKLIVEAIKNTTSNFHPHHGIYFLSWLNSFVKKSHLELGKENLKQLFDTDSTIELPQSN